MGRGGGSGGGSHGGFSSGGSRGFSSHRSSGSSSHRGGGSSGSRGVIPVAGGRSGYGGYGGFTAAALICRIREGGRRSSCHPGGAGARMTGSRKPPYKLPAIVAAIALAACLILGMLAVSAKETKPREKLWDSACISSDSWIDARLGWLADTGQVTDAMRYFYGKTGVQPYLFICDSLDGKGGESTDGEAEE